MSKSCEMKVIAPVPWCPPGVPYENYSRFRRIERKRQQGPVEVLYPRFVLGPGRSLHRFEALSMLLAIRRMVLRLHAEWPFDCIHAHFAYPEGVVAQELARRCGVPFIITEHAMWDGWMDRNARIRDMATGAVCASWATTVASFAQFNSVGTFAGCTERLTIIPNGVDGKLFKPGAKSKRKENQIIYVGFMKLNKGVDTLLRALALLKKKNTDAHLILVGGIDYDAARWEQKKQLALIGELGLTEQVTIAGPQAPENVAKLMRESALLVLPSRKESFGSVLIEALASGIPVVATRSGGPESIVNDRVGRLVPAEDPAALARAIQDVLLHLDRYDASELRDHALTNFSWDIVVDKMLAEYHRACTSAADA